LHFVPCKGLVTCKWKMKEDRWMTSCSEELKMPKPNEWKFTFCYAHWLQVFDLSLLLAGSHFWKYPAGQGSLWNGFLCHTHAGYQLTRHENERLLDQCILFFGVRWGGEANFRVFSVNSKKSNFFENFTKPLKPKKLKLKLKIKKIDWYMSIMNLPIFTFFFKLIIPIIIWYYAISMHNGWEVKNYLA